MPFLVALMLLIGLAFWLSRRFILNKIVNQQRYYDRTSVDITKESAVACYKCGAYYTGSPNYCPNCGASLKED